MITNGKSGIRLWIHVLGVDSGEILDIAHNVFMNQVDELFIIPLFYIVVFKRSVVFKNSTLVLARMPPR